MSYNDHHSLTPPMNFITILSSDMIADIVQVYFDKELYTRKKVTIVDLKPQGDGYAFSLAFIPVQKHISDPEKIEPCAHADFLVF
jgi:hypothetical protein